MTGPVERRARRAGRLTVAGALGGVALAVASVVQPPPRPLADGAVAMVNDVPLSRAEYLRSLDALAGDRRRPLDAADRRFVLERMIDEELLVQRGLELGLVRHDRKVRGDLVAAMLAAAAAEARGASADEMTLRRFYETRRERFADGVRLRLRQVFVETPPGADGVACHRRAEEAAAAWRSGIPFEPVRARYGDPEPLPLPETPLPPAKLQDYLGPTAVRTALVLPVGAVSDPIRAAGGWHVLTVVERTPGVVPPFESIRHQVETAWRRHTAEKAVRAYVRELRGRAHITIAETAW